MNKLEIKAQELANFYNIAQKHAYDALRGGIHRGLSLKAAEMVFIDVMKQETGRAPERHYTTSDIMEMTGMSRQEAESAIEALDREHPEQVIGYTFPAGLFKQPDDRDFKPHPDQPGEYIMTARGIMLLTITDTLTGTASRKEADMTGRLFKRISANGYGMEASKLQAEIMARSIEDVKSWIKAVYDIFITDTEIMEILRSL